MAPAPILSNGYEILPEGRLRAIAVDDLIERWKAGDGQFWLDLWVDEAGDLDVWLDRINAPPFARSLARDIGKTTQIIALPDFAFLEVIATYDLDDPNVGDIGFLCLKDLLVTMHPHRVEHLGDPKEMIADFNIRNLTTSGLLLAILLVYAQRDSQSTRTLRNDLIAMDEAMDADPDAVELAAILDAKALVARIVAASEEQQECVELMSEVEDCNALDFSTLRGPLSQLVSTVASVNRRADRLEKHVADLRQRYEINQQYKTNRNLNVLTVISAIFLPLTLLAGIWGMNFKDMPELDDPGAYFMALGLMAAIGVGLTIFFYAKGWFD